jgi:hypothetical protein
VPLAPESFILVILQYKKRSCNDLRIEKKYEEKIKIENQFSGSLDSRPKSLWRGPLFMNVARFLRAYPDKVLTSKIDPIPLMLRLRIQI